MKVGNVCVLQDTNAGTWRPVQRQQPVLTLNGCLVQVQAALLTSLQLSIRPSRLFPRVGLSNSLFSVQFENFCSVTVFGVWQWVGWGWGSRNGCSCSSRLSTSYRDIGEALKQLSTDVRDEEARLKLNLVYFYAREPA